MPKLWPAAVGLVAALLAVFQFGYLCSRSKIGDLEADLANARQREEALRTRIGAFEGQPGGVPQPTSAEPAEAPDTTAATRALEQAVAQLEREKAALERARDAAKREQTAAERERSKLAKEKTRLEDEVARLRERLATSQAAAPKPQATAPKPKAQTVAAASPPASATLERSTCPALERAEFAILERNAPLTRFGGKLRLEVEQQGDDLVLRVAGSRFLLDRPPQRFSFDCAGTPFVVSVCEITRQPLAVAGKIVPADAWQDACR